MYKIAEITKDIDYTSDFHDLNNDAIIKFQEWFLVKKNQRVELIVESALLKSREYNDFNLLNIENFFKKNVFSEDKPQSNIEYENSLIPEQFKTIVRVNENILTDYSKSICLDIGILFGEWLIELDSDMKWQFEKNKRMVFFGNAILKSKKSKAGYCPFHIIRNFAFKIVEKKFEDGMLINSFKNLAKGYKVFNLS